MLNFFRNFMDSQVTIFPDQCLYFHNEIIVHCHGKLFRFGIIFSRFSSQLVLLVTLHVI
uniref:Uncharacterized protein n=1 Tax=Octopus bimaculoides TaxID=37653 RepID=A0A0L8IF85_OCTBM